MMELGYASVYTRFFTLSYLQEFVWPFSSKWNLYKLTPHTARSMHLKYEPGCKWRRMAMEMKEKIKKQILLFCPS
jgi:hypothetical protein